MNHSPREARNSRLIFNSPFYGKRTNRVFAEELYHSEHSCPSMNVTGQSLKGIVQSDACKTVLVTLFNYIISSCASAV